jgi:hypothetical protein
VRPETKEEIMKPLLAKLAAAAVALTAVRAAHASEPAAPPRPFVRAGVTFTAPAPLVTVRRVDDDRWRWDRDDRFDRGGHERWERQRRAHWREAHWRAEERARLRADDARLDAARADFYASPHRPWEVRRFEAWYAGARAELDARWSRLGRVAWR